MVDPDLPIGTSVNTDRKETSTLSTEYIIASCSAVQVRPGIALVARKEKKTVQQPETGAGNRK